jgi:hypothetical protein
MSACVGQPISWLRLERYGLGELPAPECAEIELHLAACPSCGECLNRAKLDRELPELPLPLPAAKRTPRRSWRVPAWSGWVGVASAAAMLLWVMQRPVVDQPPGPRLRAKGGEFALEVVRLDPQGRLQEASHFTATDRFKVLLTCPPAWHGQAQVVVYQAGHAYFPLPGQTIDDCGNRRGLAGAFRLDGKSPVAVCVALAATTVQRERLAQGADALPALSVCARLEPSATP